MADEKVQLDTYKLNVNNVLVEVSIVQYEEDVVPRYIVNITNMSKTTKLILEKIREEFISDSDSKIEYLSKETNFLFNRFTL